MFRFVLAVGFSLAAATAGAATAPAAVDDARLRAADSDTANWMSHGRTYSEQRFSPLAQIDDGNVARLGLAWSQTLDFDRGVQATPLVVDGVIRSFTHRRLDEPQKNIGRLAALQAYEQAGLGPEDMHVAEVHDASAMGEILQVENLGFVPFGQGGPAAERGEFTVGGRLPVNPSGGLESKGHPLGATGIGQLYELVTQLRGEAGERQVHGARNAIQENGGGLQGIEEAAVAIHILSK